MAPTRDVNMMSNQRSENEGEMAVGFVYAPVPYLSSRFADLYRSRYDIFNIFPLAT